MQDNNDIANKSIEHMQDNNDTTKNNIEHMQKKDDTTKKNENMQEGIGIMQENKSSFMFLEGLRLSKVGIRTAGLLDPCKFKSMNLVSVALFGALGT